MKFLLVPLLIVGMFVSFTAALVAMLFFTETVRKPADLRDMLLGTRDSTRLAQEFRLKEDRLQDVFALADEYREYYEAQTVETETVKDSLAIEKAKIKTKEDSLLELQQQLGLIEDSTMQARQAESIKELAKFYNQLKPAAAAEILQQEAELPDTTVAMLLRNLQPAKMAKIMGFMNAEYAVRITKILRDLSP